jgi:hypothetical protein
MAQQMQSHELNYYCFFPRKIARTRTSHRVSPSASIRLRPPTLFYSGSSGDSKNNNNNNNNNNRERRGRVVSTPSEARSRVKISAPKTGYPEDLFSSVSPNKCQDSTLNQDTTAPFQGPILSNSLPSNNSTLELQFELITSLNKVIMIPIIRNGTDVMPEEL